MTLLQYFIWCIAHSFSYEDKRLTYHWTMHNLRIRWPVAFRTQDMHMCQRRTC